MSNKSLTSEFLGPSVQLLSVLLALLTLYRVTAIFFPGAVSWVESKIDDKTSVIAAEVTWSEERREEYPVKYLQHLEKQLGQREAILFEFTQDLQDESTRIERSRRELINVGKQTKAYLNEGKYLYREVERTRILPIHFVDRTYTSLAVFKIQLQVLYEEKMASESRQKLLAELQAKVNDHLLDYMRQTARVKITRELIAFQIVIAGTGKAINDLDHINDQAQAVLKLTYKLAASKKTMNDLIAVTQDLPETGHLRNQKTYDSGGFEQFLNN